MECFVTTHEVAEGVADENLANERRVGQPVKHGHRIGYFGVESLYPAVGDCSRGVDRFAEFLGPPASKMVEHLEGQTDRVGVLVALPTISLFGDLHFLAEGECLVIGELGVHGDRQVGDNAAKEFSSYPEAALNCVVVEITALGDQPSGLSQDAGSLGTGQGNRLLGNPLPVGRQAVGEVGSQVSGPHSGWFLGFGVDGELDEALVCGE